ncbi:RHS repeat domain-containing protein, partial [Anoxybacillus thermarum]|uniref:RHS repeat domain-containing protein n=1 Tax=Anoxybacillus thermarum TaxID=404937 RepID=UPI000A526281
LVEEQLPDGTNIEYSYDGFGNRKQIVKTKDGQSTTTDADYNAANQLVRFGTETISYDANGNRLEDGKYQYEWNEADQLVSITRKGESTPFVTYKYDEDGRRIQKNVNGVITNYHYQGDSLNVLYETDADGNVVRSYIYGENGQLLAMKKGTATYFYHYNAHGDVIALTDEQGNIVARYQYDAWGNILSQSGALADENPYRYAGYQYDKETGLYYLIARYYHPTHGVFLSLDPDPGDADDILTQNGYAYANNNPVMLVDPDGKFAYAVGLYFVPGVGQVMLIGTAAVVGAYGAWYLGKKLGEIDWDHIKEEHGPKSNKKMKDGKKPKSKFKSNRTLKRTTRATARTKPVRTGRYGRTIHEKTFKRPVGTDTRGKPTNRVRVIREPSGKVVTSFPFYIGCNKEFPISMSRLCNYSLR